MAKEKKPRRPRAETPRGFRDYFGAEVRARNAMLAEITKVYDSYGFDPLETSAVETVEALGKFLPDVDRPNEGVFGWQDEDEQWLALRYDLTAPLARVYAQHRRDLPLPYRRYAVGPVWRNEKPGPGRFRQFYQCDADTVGSGSVAADAEICRMLCKALENAGISSTDYEVKIGNRKILDGVLEVAGLLDPADPDANAAQRGIVLRAIDKFDRLGSEGVRALLGQERRDESGDVTEGAKLGDLQIEKIMAFVEAFRAVDGQLAQAGNALSGEARAQLDGARFSVLPETRDERVTYGRFRPIWNEWMLNYLEAIVGRSDRGWQGVKELREIVGILEALDLKDQRIRVEPSVVRGLGYYTGPVYEAELTFEIFDEKGQKRQFGSVAGGGRYDDLVKRFTGESVPACGVSIGVDRLLAALAAKGRTSAAEAGPVVVTVMDKGRMDDYQAMAAELRAAERPDGKPSVRAEVFLGSGNMARQLKYADQRSCPIAIIQGADEEAKGVVQLKDLDLGSRLAAEIVTNEDWKAQPAQFEVRIENLVQEVWKLLDAIDLRKRGQ